MFNSKFIAAIAIAIPFFAMHSNAAEDAGEAREAQRAARTQAREAQRDAAREARSAQQTARREARTQERSIVSPTEQRAQQPTSAERPSNYGTQRAEQQRMINEQRQAAQEQQRVQMQQQRASAQAAREQQRATQQQQRANEQQARQQQQAAVQAERERQRSAQQQQRAATQQTRQQQQAAMQAERERQRSVQQQQRAATQQTRQQQQAATQAARQTEARAAQEQRNAALQQQRTQTQAARQQQLSAEQQRRAVNVTSRQQDSFDRTGFRSGFRDGHWDQDNRRRYSFDRNRFGFADNVRRSVWRDRNRYYGRNWGRWHGHRWHDNDWWRPVGWGGLTAFLSFDLFGGNRGYYVDEPLYYSYGGDRIVYEANDPIVVNDVVVAPAREYAVRAINTARLYDDLVEETTATAVAADEWKPLGIYAVTDASKAVDKRDPDRYFELVISKKGAIGGTYHDLIAGKDYPIYGAVDPKTQRAAWMIEDSKNVFETGIYNLTQPETPALHIRPDVTRQVVLIRIEDPEASSVPTDTSYTGEFSN
jgi:hypothetical protein